MAAGKYDVCELRPLMRSVLAGTVLAAAPLVLAGAYPASLVSSKTYTCWRLTDNVRVDEHSPSLLPQQTHVCLGRNEILAFNSPTTWERWKLSCEAEGDESTVICKASGDDVYEIALTIEKDSLHVSDNGAGKEKVAFAVVGTFTRPPHPGLEQEVSALPTTEAQCRAASACIAIANRVLSTAFEITAASAEKLGSVTKCRAVRNTVVDQLKREQRDVPAVCGEEPK